MDRAWGYERVYRVRIGRAANLAAVSLVPTSRASVFPASSSRAPRGGDAFEADRPGDDASDHGRRGVDVTADIATRPQRVDVVAEANGTVSVSPDVIASRGRPSEPEPKSRMRDYDLVVRSSRRRDVGQPSPNQISIYRVMTPAERLRQAERLYWTAGRIREAHVREVTAPCAAPGRW